MKTRNAKISDVKAIYSLINFYAEQDKMLFRTMADIYENLQSFLVSEVDGEVAGCCALQIIWADLAEIKSLAVDDSKRNLGIGKMLVSAAAKNAKQLGLKRIFALTLAESFFTEQGFEVIEKDSLPMKVWSDCAKCPKQNNCDEIAVIRNLS